MAAIPSVLARRLAGVAFLSVLCCAATLSPAAARPDHAEAIRLNNLGVALMNQQNFEEAARKFNRAFQTDPTLVTAEINRGIALFSESKLEEAGKALNHAAELSPSDPRVWYNLGLLHLAEGKKPTALDDFLRVCDLSPNNPDAHYFAGSIFLQLQRYDEAIKQFETALRSDPLHASAEFGLARALQRTGNNAEALKHLNRFEHLTREKISSAIESGYGGQGGLSLAQDVRTTEPMVGPMIPITFVAQTVVTSNKSTRTHTAPEAPLGGGACLIDVDGDRKLDLVAMAEGEHAIEIYRNDGAGHFELVPARKSGLLARGHGTSCAVGDFDNDGLPDLAAVVNGRVSLYRNLGNSKFVEVTQSAKIEQLNNPAGLTFIDFDHDGDLDLFVTGKPASDAGGKNGSSGPNVLWRNNGNSTFTNWTQQTGLGGTSDTVSAILSDINNDRAIDIVTTGSGAAPTLYTNAREGAFDSTRLVPEADSVPTTGIYVFDFDKDGWMDVALTHAGPPGVSLWRNSDGKHFQRVPLPTNAKRGWGLTAVDFDNDGWIDLAVILETESGSELHLFRNEGPRGFEDVSESVGLRKLKLTNARSVLATDVDGDGDADLFVTQLGQSPIWLRNDGGNRNHSLRIALAGLADNASALGTKVEVFAGGVWQKWEIAGSSGYLSQGANEVLAGMGSAERADVIRMLWPTGVLQDEIEIAGKKAVDFKEVERRGSSCPTLFAWDGEGYEFVSDVIGAAVIGHWISPTEKNAADPDEWVKIDGSRFKPKDGYYSVRFGEPMEEVNYLDQLRLVAVDHPDGTDVFPDERFVSAPPFPSGKPIVTSRPHAPVGAWDDGGTDVADILRSRDHKYVRNFTNLKFAGFANNHALTLDLGEWSQDNPLRLYLDGFIEYFTATSMYAAWQADLSPIAPYLEAQMPDGTWKRVMDDMGFPAGLPRTIVVDLTRKLPPGVRRIRIVTNLQIYWDRILVDNGPDRASDAILHELPLSSATLASSGYPEQVEGETPGDLTYRYDRSSATGPFSRPRGLYTRFGAVTPLLKSADDRFVIFGSGEDIDAEFSAEFLPPVRQGYKRDFFFYANGFVKDMDFYEASPFTVSQMPFHAMGAYPYPARENYPQDPSATEYRLHWNDRFESGENERGYRFNYQPRGAHPQAPSETGDR